jgi:hypothetical protein
MPVEKMKQNHGEVVNTVEEGWKAYLDNLDASLTSLEKHIEETGKKTEYCTEDWCFATEHVLEDLVHTLFTLHVPKTATVEDEHRLANLKKRVQNLYAQFKSVPGFSPSEF